MRSNSSNDSANRLSTRPFIRFQVVIFLAVLYAPCVPESVEILRGDNWMKFCDLFRNGADGTPIGCLRAKPFYTELPKKPYVQTCNVYSVHKSLVFENVTGHGNGTKCVESILGGARECGMEREENWHLRSPFDVANRTDGEDVGCLNPTNPQCRCRYCEQNGKCLVAHYTDKDHTYLTLLNITETCPGWLPYNVAFLRCAKSCPDGYLPNLKSRVEDEIGCKRCSLGRKCKICRTDSNAIHTVTICTECFPPYIRFANKSSGEYECVERCPVGYGLRAKDHSECVPCGDPNCLDCAHNFNKCDKCADDKFESGFGRCGTSCSAGTFKTAIDVDGKSVPLCLECPLGCLECAAWDRCKRCKPSYMLINGSICLNPHINETEECAPQCSYGGTRSSPEQKCFDNANHFGCEDCLNFKIEVRLRKFCVVKCPLKFRPTVSRNCIPITKTNEPAKTRMKSFWHVESVRIYMSTSIAVVCFSIIVIRLSILIGTRSRSPLPI